MALVSVIIPTTRRPKLLLRALATNLRGVDDEATSVAIGAKGAIVVGGLSCTGSFAGGTLASDFAVLRYTSTGWVTWSSWD